MAFKKSAFHCKTNLVEKLNFKTNLKITFSSKFRALGKSLIRPPDDNINQPIVIENEEPQKVQFSFPLVISKLGVIGA